MSWIGWQIDYLLLLQSFRDLSGHIFDNFFLTVTRFGEIAIPAMFMSFVYWCWNKKAGIYIIWSYMFGFITNMFLKTTACIYRPWILDSRVVPLEQAFPAATGYSFPSGHTAGAMTTWGSTAVIFWKNKYIRYVCMGLILLIMFSRNYLGVHTPQDVIVSFLVCLFILFIVKKILKWESEGKNRDLVLIGIITLINILLLLYVNLKNYPMDYINGQLLFNPCPVKTDSFARIGTAMGIFYGWLLEKRFINFNPKMGNYLHKIIRGIIGFAVVYLISSFGETVFVNYIGEKAGLFVDYFVIGLFITFIYPYAIKLSCGNNK